jgi:hypothetical protein
MNIRKVLVGAMAGGAVLSAALFNTAVAQGTVYRAYDMNLRLDPMPMMNNYDLLPRDLSSHDLSYRLNYNDRASYTGALWVNHATASLQLHQRAVQLTRTYHNR